MKAWKWKSLRRTLVISAAIVLMAQCAETMAAPASVHAVRVPDKANMVEGDIRTNLPILFSWDISTPARATASTNSQPSSAFFASAWLEFLPERKAALAHLKYASWPHSGWIVQLEILDAGGKAIHQPKLSLQNSGTIERSALEEESELKFDLGPEVWSRGRSFRLSIETLWSEQSNAFLFGEEVPLAFSLSTVASSEFFRACWLRVEQTNAQATVHAELLSWPKSRWRMRLELFDGEGRPAGKGEKTFENAGVIGGRAMRSGTDIQLLLINLDISAQPLRRYLLRVERIPDND